MASAPSPVHTVLPHREIRGLDFIANARNIEQLHQLIDTEKVRAEIPRSICDRWHAALAVVPDEFKYNLVRCWAANEDLLLFIYHTAQALQAEDIHTIYGIGVGEGLFETLLAEALQGLYGADAAVERRLMDFHKPKVAFSPIDIYTVPEEALSAGSTSSLTGALAIPESFFAADCSKSVLCTIMPCGIPAELLDLYLSLGGIRLIGAGMASGTGALGFGPTASLTGDTALLDTTFAGKPHYGVVIPQIGPRVDYLPGFPGMPRSYEQVHNVFVVGMGEAGASFLLPHHTSKSLIFYTKSRESEVTPILARRDSMVIMAKGSTLSLEERQESCGDFWATTPTPASFDNALRQTAQAFFGALSRKELPKKDVLQHLRFLLGGGEVHEIKSTLLEKLKKVYQDYVSAPPESDEGKLVALLTQHLPQVVPAPVPAVAVVVGAEALSGGAGSSAPAPASAPAP